MLTCLCGKQTERFWKGTCQNCYNRQRTQENPELFRQKRREQHLRHQAKRIEYSKVWNKNHRIEIKNKQLEKYIRTDAIKIASPCMDCNNYFSAECMDFDHRPAEIKIDNISFMIRDNLSWSKIEAEIKKCDIVCANCHRTRTKWRQKSKRIGAA